jgi:hypothetical protein
MRIYNPVLSIAGATADDQFEVLVRRSLSSELSPADVS